MIIGIEQTTDLRCPDTNIRKFSSEAAARRWLTQERETLAFPGAADNRLPMGRQNFHHRIRKAYRMPKGFRIDHHRDEVAVVTSTSDYPRRLADRQSHVYRQRAAEEITI